LPRDIQYYGTRFVLFSAGVDLSMYMVVPALFNLNLDKQLPQRISLWISGRNNGKRWIWLIIFLQERSETFAAWRASRREWAAFATTIRRRRADPEEDDGFAQPREALHTAE